MKQVILLLLCVSLIFSCKTLQYVLTEEIRGDKLKTFQENIVRDAAVPVSGELRGIYSEKDKSYRFHFQYNRGEEAYYLKFYELLSDQMIFDAEIVQGDRNYNYFSMAFFSVKIGIILENFCYLVQVSPEEGKVFKTNDDYFLLKDDEGNYYKYDASRLIKKENLIKTVRYYYSRETTQLERALLETPSLSFNIIFE